MPPRFLLTLLVLSHAVHALDLTPHFGNRELEGVKIPVLRFADSGRKANYRPPAEWKVSGTATELSLLPPKGKDSRATFFVRAFTPADATGDLEKWARTFLPENATEIAAVAEAESPFMLGNLASHEFIFSYQQTGLRFLRSVAVVNLSDKERLAVVISARQEDFKSTHAEAIASLFSWEWED